MEFRPAAAADIQRLKKLDTHITGQELENSIRLGRVYLAEEGGQLAGWLRYGLFWDSIPFLNLLFLLEGSRGKGYGRKLMEYWEERMGRLGCPLVMTSTASDEYAQHFYHKLGYSVVGGFQPEDAPFELILAKKLGSQERM